MSRASRLCAWFARYEPGSGCRGVGVGGDPESVVLRWGCRWATTRDVCVATLQVVCVRACLCAWRKWCACVHACALVGDGEGGPGGGGVLPPRVPMRTRAPCCPTPTLHARCLCPPRPPHPSPSATPPPPSAPHRVAPARQTECHSERAFCEVSRPCLSQPHDPTQVVVAHSLRFLGFQVEAVCGCVKSSCCALGAADLREVSP